MTTRRKARRTSARAIAPPRSPREVKLPLKKATVTALLELDAEVKRAQAQVAVLQQRMHDRLSSIFTERGIEEADVVSVDDQPPYTMTLLVKKAATKEGGGP